MQSRLSSFIEAWVNVAIGFGINFTMNFLILPVVGLPMPSVGQNFAMGLLFTVVSVARSYAVRRWFNARINRFANIMAGRIEQ
ncbi:MAG: hypothetical protein LT106_08965 [Burkholderiaceae bacterium]|nr:hypothetical protein [Burkholderiaceae bacterium]